LIHLALRDPHPGVRRHALRLFERTSSSDPELGPALLRLIDDPDAQARLQLAFTLGEWRDPRAGKALATMALAYAQDPYLTAAALSSVHRDNLAETLAGAFAGKDNQPPP